MPTGHTTSSLTTVCIPHSPTHFFLFNTMAYALSSPSRPDLLPLLPLVMQVAPGDAADEEKKHGAQCLVHCSLPLWLIPCVAPGVIAAEAILIHEEHWGREQDLGEPPIGMAESPGIQ